MSLPPQPRPHAVVRDRSMHSKKSNREDEYNHHVTDKYPDATNVYVKAPQNKVARFLWKWRTRFESTFVLTMLEPWERWCLTTIVTIATVAFWYSVFTYAPGHIAFLRRRYLFYVYGVDLPEHIIATSSGSSLGFDRTSLKSGVKQLHTMLGTDKAWRILRANWAVAKDMSRNQIPGTSASLSSKPEDLAKTVAASLTSAGSVGAEAASRAAGEL